MIFFIGYILSLVSFIVFCLFWSLTTICFTMLMKIMCFSLRKFGVVLSWYMSISISKFGKLSSIYSLYSFSTPFSLFPIFLWLIFSFLMVSDNFRCFSFFFSLYFSFSVLVLFAYASFRLLIICFCIVCYISMTFLNFYLPPFIDLFTSCNSFIFLYKVSISILLFSDVSHKRSFPLLCLFIIL